MKRHDERDWRDQYTTELNREQQRIASRKAAAEMARRERNEQMRRGAAVALLWAAAGIIVTLAIHAWATS